MRLSQLLEHEPVTVLAGPTEIDIAAVDEDSRLVGPGALFVARAGASTDGRAFVADACRRGAIAVLSDGTAEVPGGVTALAVDDVAAAAARLAERLCGHPSRALRVIGVTGTNGKTTTAHLVRQVLDAAGTRCGLIGTVTVDEGAGPRPAELTTPPAMAISRHLRAMVDNGCAAVVLEVSSHALAQGRVAGIEFDVGIFTNLSGDHLDYHGTMDAYADAKAELFSMLGASGTAIVNVDDARSDRMVAASEATVVRTSAAGAPSADWRAEVHGLSRAGVDLTVTAPGETFDLHLPLVGRHNVANALQAAAAATALGVPPARVAVALETATAPPGRLEPVTGRDDTFAVLVDYAHTDDALANVLRALREVIEPPGRLRVVFGCGGDRDRTKRPRMASIACEFADDVVVTSDNPRTEEPEAIIADVVEGIPAARRDATRRDADRAAAIEWAVGECAPGDILLIAGKGHEDYQIIGTTKRPFDDRVVAAAALARRAQRAGAAR